MNKEILSVIYRLKKKLDACAAGPWNYDLNEAPFYEEDLACRELIAWAPLNLFEGSKT